MSFTIDDSQLLGALDALLDRVTQAVEAGLTAEATEAQALMHDTTAHGDVTGATRSSYRAFVIGGSHTGDSEAASGYAAAESAIAANGKAHGRALRQDSGVHLSADERGILYTSYTDYQHQLEIQGKAVLGPALQATQDDATRKVAEASKAALT